ncbi:MAG: hypothetical protein ACJ8AT_02970 [Hyalangium sp.]|uniref:hypothetical protein n=1 Tax=Hyalangium sp. TaxID=2028555 RepID=UPI003899CF1C
MPDFLVREVRVEFGHHVCPIHGNSVLHVPHRSIHLEDLNAIAQARASIPIDSLFIKGFGPAYESFSPVVLVEFIP